MSDSWASSPIADLPNCPSCGNPLLHAPDNKCPLCGQVLDADVAVSDDATPYASSPRKSYGHTLWWLVTAGSYRLGHIARMRRSSASVRFARFNLLLLAASAVLIALPHHGWQRIVDYGATYPDGYPQPANSGWHLQGMAPAPQGSQSGAGKLVRLWWNPGVWSLSLGLNFVIVFLLGGLVLLLARVGSNRALRAPHRDEGRFSAAIHYSTVHIAMLFLAACCYGSGILHDFAEIMRWSVHWPKNVHRVPAYLLAGMGFFLYWFWMLRIAHSSPPETRGRVSRFFGFWVPLEAALLIGGWIVGQHHGLPYLAKLLKMGFYE